MHKLKFLLIFVQDYFNYIIMSTYRELVYLVLDELKGISDDFTYTEDHVIFLLGKYRNFLLKQKYGNDPRKDIPDSNFQDIKMDLIPTPAISGSCCEGGSYLRTTTKVPNFIGFGTTKVYIGDQLNSEMIALVSRERIRYVGYNKWLKPFGYATIGADDYLYIKYFNPQTAYLKNVTVSGIFEDSEAASELTDECKCHCDILDRKFSLEEALIPTLIESVVKELSGAIYRPKDTDNNAKDDLPDKASDTPATRRK